MILAALCVELGMAAILMYAGAWKVARPGDLHGTLVALDLRVSTGWIATLGFAEIVVAACLVLLPGNLVVAAAVMTLGVAFAAAGLLAYVRGLEVDCACLGPDAQGRLGLRQVALLPAWLLVAAIGLSDNTPAFADARPYLMIALALLLTLDALRRVEPLAREHRVLRRLLDGQVA